MRYSATGVGQWAPLIAVSVSIWAILLIQHNATALAPPKPSNETKLPVDPLIEDVVVKTYNSLNVPSFRSETLFRNGQLVGKWKGCGADGVQFKGCKVIPGYQDRLSIEYTFDRNRLDEYTLHEPSVETLTTGASAELQDFSFRDDLRFTIIFRCATRVNGTSMEVFDLTLPVLKDFAIKTRFGKNCSSGAHPYVRIGTVKGGIARVLPLPLEPISASPTDLTTDLLIRVSLPAESQIHGLARLNSSNDGIRASLRGIANEETITVGKDLRFSVLYECNVNGESDVSIAVPVPPWEDLRIRVKKKCGGRVPKMLSIGTTFSGSDIVEKGIPRPGFREAKGDSVDVNRFVLTEERNSFKLYLRNTNEAGGEVVHAGRMHFTVRDSGVMKVVGEKYDGRRISGIGPGDTVVENVKFVCRKKGSTSVLVSILILQYEVVDFELEKRCREPISYRESGIESWWTVDGIEDVVLVVAAVLLVGWCLRTRRNGDQKILRLFGLRGYDRLDAQRVRDMS